MYTQKRLQMNISTVVNYPWTLNITLLKQQSEKITYFSTEVSFAAMINKLNEMIRKAFRQHYWNFPTLCCSTKEQFSRWHYFQRHEKPMLKNVQK